jgi:hypothetical protein
MLMHMTATRPEILGLFAFLAGPCAKMRLDDVPDSAARVQRLRLLVHITASCVRFERLTW